MKKQVHVCLPAPMTAPEALSQVAELSKQAVKKAMNKGAVWIEEKGKRVRLRKASRQLSEGTKLWLFYDAELLKRTVPPAKCVAASRGWSVWFKPAGMVTQGSEWGDHLSLMRQVEKQQGKSVWMVHRLDRETPGLVVLAHHRQAAGWLSQQFQKRQVEKIYYAWVLGRLEGSGEINRPLDGKAARTVYEVCGYRAEPVLMTLVRIKLCTGRLHQIRRHFSAVGHPVVGDPRYGQTMPDQLPMQLLAWQLGFYPSPKSTQQVFTVTEEMWHESGVLQYSPL